MVEAARMLVDAGARIVAVGASTGHKFLGDLRQPGVSFLHLVDAVRDHLAAERIGCLVLLGTKYVLDDPFLTDRINADRQVDFIKPESADVDRLHGRVFCVWHTGSECQQGCPPARALHRRASRATQ